MASSSRKNVVNHAVDLPVCNSCCNDEESLPQNCGRLAIKKVGVRGFEPPTF